jgi:RND family efflux transporter MFP subunit
MSRAADGSGGLRSLLERVVFAPHDQAAGGRRLVAARVLVPIVILALGVVGARVLVATGPKAERKPRARQARVVEIVRAEVVDAPVVLGAMGPAMPAQEVELRPQVSGEIVEFSEDVVPGGLFPEGELLMRIDPRDYELAVRQRASDVALAERDLKLEMGQQLVAKREYELLGEVIREDDAELVLRMPQLESAKQRLEAAKAALEDARLDLERTKIAAALVRAKHVDRGEIVTQVSVLADLVGTDEYWIEVAVPVADLEWITVPRRRGEPGSAVRIYDPAAWGADTYRTGEVLRLAGDLGEEGRMARVLVSVRDPLSLLPEHQGKPALLIGSYLRVEIEGQGLTSVVSLDRKLLRDGDAVWVMTDDDTLAVRPVEVAYRGRDHVLVSAGITVGDRLVMTDLPAPVPGMPLRLRDGADGAPGAGGGSRERADEPA